MVGWQVALSYLVQGTAFVPWPGGLDKPCQGVAVTDCAVLQDRPCKMWTGDLHNLKNNHIVYLLDERRMLHDQGNTTLTVKVIGRLWDLPSAYDFPRAMRPPTSVPRNTVVLQSAVLRIRITGYMHLNHSVNECLCQGLQVPTVLGGGRRGFLAQLPGERRRRRRRLRRHSCLLLGMSTRISQSATRRASRNKGFYKTISNDSI